MARECSVGTRSVVLASLVVAIAWLGAARADEILDRSVRFHISAAPLASALIEFSTQSGIQIAVADADVSHLQANGVDGTYANRAALSMLLRGTALEFARVGAETVAIRVASAGPVIGALVRSGEPAAVPTAPAATSSLSDSGVNANAAPELPAVTVMAPRPPTEQELAGDSLYQFIVHHATVHYVNTGVMGNLAHWRGGRPQTICPLTMGLDPAYNAFVTARIRAVAANVGAPVQADLHCQDNVRVLFTTQPEKVMADVVQWASVYFGVRYPPMKRLLKFSGGHGIQGWYITTRGGGRVLNTDVALLGSLELLPLWPLVIPTEGNGGGSGMSGIVSVILVADTTKVAGYGIGTIADYMAQLALSVVQQPDHCDPLPSILDLSSSSCGTREKPTAITAGDLAFLKGLYYRNTGLGSSLSRDEIQTYMTRQFKGQ